MNMYQKREMRKNKKMNEDTKSLPSTSINWYIPTLINFSSWLIFFIPYKEESISLEVEENYNISGNNVAGFILTIKGEK